MSKIIILGGCGAVGSVAVKALAGREEFKEVVIGDINTQRAEALKKEIGSPKVSVVKVDVGDAASVKAAVKGCDLVLNCSGPFYKFVKTTLTAVIEAGVDYLDVCDDVDVTLDILKMDEVAKKANVTCLIGMGSSPGVTNLLAKLASDSMLEETEAIDIYHAHGGEPIEGEGVIGHRFHCMSIDCPMFLDGELKYVKFFEPDGIALQEEVSFHRLGDGIRVYPYPHPEQVTMPNYIKTQRVTNKGTVLPQPYYDLIKDLCALGLGSKEAIDVKGQPVVPYDLAVAWILKRRDEILKEVDFGAQRGCVKVVVSGKKGGKPHKYVFSLASENQALGEGTGIPAAIGAMMMQRGMIKEKGVMPPEACVDPMQFIALVSSVMKISGGGEDKGFDGVIVESIDAAGKVERLEM